VTDDITHNLTVVREALEAEGLTVHVKLIDAAIEDVAKLNARLATARKAMEGMLREADRNTEPFIAARAWLLSDEKPTAGSEPLRK
jgi:hypothetical protein